MELLAFAVLLVIAVYDIPTSESSDERIVGGMETTIEKYPYQLALKHWHYGDRYAHGCGASLIRPNIALTAAHCTDGRKPEDYTIRANSSRRDRGGIVVRVSQFCQHPQFKDRDYDVTVLLLDKPLPLGPGIQTIPLQEAGVEVKDGAYGTVAGWGHLKFGGRSPKVLREVKLPKVNSYACKKKLQRVAPTTPRMVCFGYDEGGKSPCQGDSGGAIVVEGKQVGIVSWGHQCARPNSPTVFTKISAKAIHKHIDKCIAKFSYDLC